MDRETAEPVEMASLLLARNRMIAELHAGLNPTEREFLDSLARNQPKVDLLDIPHITEIPGTRLKMRNLEELTRANPEKFESQPKQLEVALNCRGNAATPGTAQRMCQRRAP